jgi:hypothetical protein
VFERAESEATPDRSAEERAEAAARLADLEALSQRLDKRAADLDEIAQARSAWYAETTAARERADQARAELRRRGAAMPTQEQVADPLEVDRTERQTATSPDEPQPVAERDVAQVVTRETEREPASERLYDAPVQREEPVVEPDELDRSEREEPAPEPPEPDEITPERDDSAAVVSKTEPEPPREPARAELTEDRVRTELQRAREATGILAERQAERHRAEVEAQAERDREYDRRRSDDLDHELDFQHEVEDAGVSEVGRGLYDD